MRDAAELAGHRRGGLAGRAQTAARNTHGDLMAVNTSETIFERFSIAGIKGAVITDPHQRQNVMAVEIETATDTHISEGRWVILAEPMTPNSIGRANASGTMLATVIINDEDDAGITATADGLVSSATNTHGTILVLGPQADPPPGDGEDDSRLCLVSIAPPADVVLYGKADADWVDDGEDTANGCYVMVTRVKNLDGDALDPAPTASVKIYLPRSGRREDPNVRADDVIVYVDAGTETDGGDPYPIGVCITDVLDGKCGESIKLLEKAATVPAGWEEVEAATQCALVGNADPESDGATHGEDTFNGTDIAHDPVSIDSSLIADHDLSGVTTKNEGPGELTHSSASVTLPDHEHVISQDMRQASGLQMEYTVVDVGGVSTYPTPSSSHSHDAHSVGELEHTHTFESSQTLSHSGSGEAAVEHTSADISKWVPWYTVKVIIRVD